MPETRLGAARAASIVGLSALTLGIGLGSSGRLTYHEAFVAQAARELIARGAVLVPTIDGRPWLEKPPLAFWLVALAGRMAGGVTEFVARAPSAVAATLLALGVAAFTARRFGREVGWLAGLVQASTFWLVVRGRLAEADVVLACLITWTIVAFDRLRTWDLGRRAEDSGGPIRGPHPAHFASLSLRERAGVGVVARPPGPETGSSDLHPTGHAPRPRPLPLGEGGEIAVAFRVDAPSVPREAPAAWRWAFFAALGATALVKGLGFGAVLVGSAVATVLIWDRDRRAIRDLMSPKGWALAGVLALTWPALVAIRLPSAVSLWALHVTDRLASHPEHFIGGPWWQYGPAILGQALPWTPLALLGAWPSLLRTVGRGGRGGVDRLLWAWAVVPVLVLSAATVKNAHYAIHALPPLATWAALGLAAVALQYPQLYGNGKGMAYQAFVGIGGLGTLAALSILKPLVTSLCIGSGASGGLFTPTMSTGAVLGGFLGLAWSQLWPGTPAGAYAMIGAAAMIGAGMQAPLAALALVLELTHTGFALMVPMVIATVIATAVTRWIDGYSIYSARLSAPAPVDV